MSIKIATPLLSTLMALFLLPSLFLPDFLSAAPATFHITILVEDGVSGKPVSNATVSTSHRRGIVGLLHNGRTNERGEAYFKVDFGYFSPRGSGNFPEIGTEGVAVDFAVSREGYQPYSGSGMFHVRPQGPTIIRLQPLNLPPSRQVQELHLVSPPGAAGLGQPTKSFAEQPITGELIVISEPPGATVKINGESALNKTPLAVNIQAGSHKIELKLGKTVVARDITVPMGSSLIFQVVFAGGEPTPTNQERPVFQIN